MHIVIVIPNISVVGGTTRVATNLANYWVSQKYKVTIITFVAYQNTYYMIHYNVNIVVANIVESTTGITGCCYYNVKRIFKLRKLINNLKPNIVLTIGATLNILLAIGLPVKRNYLIIGTEHIHPPNRGLNILLKLLQILSYKYLDAVVALTKKTNVWIYQHTKARHVVTIPNQLNYPLMNKTPIIIPKAIVNSSKKILLAIGRLHPQKGFDLLISIFAKLITKHSDWQLVILGEGKQRLELEQQITILELQNKVYMPGSVGNLAHWYQVADLFVLSSRYEGLPCTLMEAMAYGVPAVSFDCPTGPSDIIIHEVNGLLVENDNIIELATSLDMLMSNKALRQQLAAKAIEVQKKFSIENTVSKWDKLFAELTT